MPQGVPHCRCNSHLPIRWLRFEEATGPDKLGPLLTYGGLKGQKGSWMKIGFRSLFCLWIASLVSMLHIICSSDLMGHSYILNAYKSNGLLLFFKPRVFIPRNQALQKKPVKRISLHKVRFKKTPNKPKLLWKRTVCSGSCTT